MGSLGITSLVQQTGQDLHNKISVPACQTVEYLHRKDSLQSSCNVWTHVPSVPLYTTPILRPSPHVAYPQRPQETHMPESIANE